MVQIKPADADRLLARPDASVRVVLVYGDDEGLVAERAESFARAVTGVDGEHLRLDLAALADNPGRLADEANAVPMFGGRRAITLRAAGNRALEFALQPLLDRPPVDSWVIVTAGELRKSSPLRRLAESHPAAWAIACYADGARDLDRLIDDELKRAGIALAPDARAALKGLVGGDRMQSRSEIRKLLLYAAGNATVTLADVAAIVGDSAAFAVDETVDAAVAGDAAAFDLGYRRLVAAGTPGFVVAGAALRHFNFLQRARAAFDAGEPADAIVRAAAPPIYPYARQTAVARQIERWPSSRIERALAGLDRAMVESRLNGNIADAVVGQALQFVALLGAPARRA